MYLIYTFFIPLFLQTLMSVHWGFPVVPRCVRIPSGVISVPVIRGTHPVKVMASVTVSVQTTIQSSVVHRNYYSAISWTPHINIFHSYRLYFPDIDECSTNVSRCDGNCTDTVGSYYCTCSPGFQLGTDRFSCLGDKNN